MIGYTDSTALTAYATARGVTLEGDPDVLLTKALDYMETLSYKGEKTDEAQPLEWPRTGVYINGVEIDDATVPAKVATAQLALSLDIDAGKDPLAPSEQAVKREKVDVLEVEYQDNTSSSAASKAFNAILRDYLASTAGGATFEVVR